MQRAVSGFVDSAQPGDSVTIYSFDQKTTLRPTVRIADERDKRDLLRVVDSLRATGDRTHTGMALRDALMRSVELAQRPDASTRAVSIVLLTDGLEDVRDIPDPVSIPSNITLVAQASPYIFFVSLGSRDHEDQLERFVLDPSLAGRGAVIRDPGAEALSALEKRVRPIVESAVVLPATVDVVVSPTELDFGDCERGRVSQMRDLAVRSSVATRVKVAVDGDNEVISVVDESHDISADAPTRIKVRVAIADNAAAGDYEFGLLLQEITPTSRFAFPTVRVVGRVSVVIIPVWRRVLKWLALIAFVLLVAVSALCFLTGSTPASVWRGWRRRNHLEGELEILRPVPKRPEDAFVSLWSRARQRERLSVLVPDAIAGESDAELSTFYKDGTKRIRLEVRQGDVRVNELESGVIELFDGDILELGNARLRFNRVGHERPPAAETEA